MQTPIESQHTEWKESWRDDHLRWVCGFANAEGGRLEIGRNDKGVIVGLADAPKLLEDLPNKKTLNALVHRDYAVGAPVQIRVYENRLKIWNPAVLPEGWTLENLLSDHASTPYNPDVANAFFRAGEIETWGRGIQRIFEACENAGTPAPIIDYKPNDLWLEFPFSPEYLKAIRQGEEGAPPSMLDGKLNEKAPVTDPVTAPVTAPVSDYVEKLLRLLGQRETLGNEDVRLAFSLKSRRRLRETYLAPAMAAGLIEYTIPEKPNSRLQKYRLTEKGRAWLSHNQP